MPGIRQYAVLALALSLQGAVAKTDMDGCTSFTSMVTVRPEPGYGNTYETVIWFMTDNLEICQGVDCGGGRAPPKTVPGCPAYTGTETVKPSFLSSNPFDAPAQTTAPPVTSTSLDVTVTNAPTTTASNGSSAGAGESSSGDASPSQSSGSGSGPAPTTTSGSPATTSNVDSAAVTNPVNLALGLLAAAALL